MRQLWSFMAAVLLTAFMIYLGFQLIAPYAGLILLAMVLVIVTGVGYKVLQRRRYW